MKQVPAFVVFVFCAANLRAQTVINITPPPALSVNVTPVSQPLSVTVQPALPAPGGGGAAINPDTLVRTTRIYANPAWLTSISPAIVAQNATNRLVTDAEKAAWNAKLSAESDPLFGSKFAAAIAAYDTRAVNDGRYRPIGYVPSWGEVTGKPQTFAPVPHDHDDRYFTESESDARYLQSFTETDPVAALHALRTDNPHNTTAAQVGAYTTAQTDAIAAGKVDKITGKGLSTEDYTTAEKTKLAGVAPGATANDTDANLRARGTHTGTQAIATVAGLQTALDGKAATVHTHTTTEVTEGTNLYYTPARAAAAAPVQSVNGQTGAVSLTIPAAQVSSDWNASSGVAQILNKPTIPANTNQLTNGAGFITSSGAPVQSVAGKTGAVSLVVGDVSGAAPLASPTFTGTVTVPQLNLNGTINAASGSGLAALLTPTLTATANNDQLFVLDLNPTVNAGAFTGVGSWGIRTSRPIIPRGDATVNFGAATARWANLFTVNLVATSLTGLVKGNGSNAATNATAGTDFVAPGLTTASGLTMNTGRVLGRTTAGTGAVEELVIGTGAGQVAAGDHTHANATTSVAGFLSAADKTKLDGIAANANNYTLPTASASTLGGVRVGSGLSIDGSGILSATAGGGGTVTSFSSGSLSPLFSTSVATPTTTPALSFALSGAAQNAFWAGPSAGGAGTPSYRAIVAADVPVLNQNTTGTAANVTGTVAVANGGTGATTVAGARTALGLGTASTLNVAATGNAAAGEVVRGDDGRLSDARVPTAHTHNASDLNAGTVTAARMPAFTGDVTSTAGTTTLTITPGAVVNADLANAPANTLKGNNTGSAAAPADLTATQVRTLLNVADGATANSTDAALRDRTTHTGTQTASTISDFNTAARGAISLTTTGTSGAATYNSSTGALNIPNYTTGGSRSVLYNTITADVTATTGTTLFTQALEANANYIVRLVTRAAGSAATNGGVQFTINVPSGGTISCTNNSPMATSSTITHQTTSGAYWGPVNWPTAGASFPMQATCVVTTTTAGNMTVDFRRSSAGTATVQAGSSMATEKTN